MTPGPGSATALFADLVGYTEFLQADEAAARALVLRFRTAVQAAAGGHAGHVAQFYGDGALCVFDSAESAVGAALALQAALRTDPPFPLRVGLHRGHLTSVGGLPFGTAVNLASRIESLATPGSILFSGSVEAALPARPGLERVSLGWFRFKGFSRSHQVFALAAPGLVVPARGELSGKLEPSLIQRRPRATIAATIAGAVALSLLAARLWSPAPPPAPGSVAVLPFLASGADEYLGHGLADSIIHQLASLRGLRVAGRASVAAARAGSTDPAALASRLGVAHLLEGSVRAAGDRLLVDVRLLDLPAGHIRWTRSFDLPADDTRSLQEDIARAVAESLRVRISAAEDSALNRRATASGAAHDIYLRGRLFWNRRSADDVRRSLDLFEQALRIDPGFALAHVGVADAWNILGDYNWEVPRDAFPRAIAAARHALSIDDSLAAAHCALAYARWHTETDWRPVEESFRRAIQLDPGYATAHQWFAGFLSMVGRHAEAAESAARAREIEPLSLIVLRTEVRVRWYATRQFARARDGFLQVLELDPGFTPALSNLSACHYFLGDDDACVDIQLRLLEREGLPPADLTLLREAFTTGGLRAFHAAWRDLVAATPESRPGANAQRLALLSMLAGDIDGAWAQVVRALATQGPVIILPILGDPLWEPLRNDPRVRDLIARGSYLVPPP